MVSITALTTCNVEAGGFLSKLGDSLKQAAQNTQTHSTNSNSSITKPSPLNYNLNPVIGGPNNDVVRIENPYQATFFAMAYYKDHIPSKLTPKTIYHALGSLWINHRTEYPSKELNNIYQIYNGESDVFKRQQQENSISQKISPYYEKYRGYSKVFLTTTVFEHYRPGLYPLLLSHYNLETKSFRLGYSSVDCPMAEEVINKLSNAAIDNSTGIFFYNMPMFMKKEACDLYVPDQAVAQRIEYLISNNKLSNSDIKLSVLSNVVFNPQNNQYYFVPQEAILQIFDPITNKEIYRKPYS